MENKERSIEIPGSMIYDINLLGLDYLEGDVKFHAQKGYISYQMNYMDYTFLIMFLGGGNIRIYRTESKYDILLEDVMHLPFHEMNMHKYAFNHMKYLKRELKSMINR